LFVIKHNVNHLVRHYCVAPSDNQRNPDENRNLDLKLKVIDGRCGDYTSKFRKVFLQLEPSCSPKVSTNAVLDALQHADEFFNTGMDLVACKQEIPLT
jgi:hypothetical protein